VESDGHEKNKMKYIFPEKVRLIPSTTGLLPARRFEVFKWPLRYESFLCINADELGCRAGRKIKCGAELEGKCRIKNIRIV
jgi:hypothetical protein